jgi:hypothetical protein
VGDQPSGKEEDMELVAGSLRNGVEESCYKLQVLGRRSSLIISCFFYCGVMLGYVRWDPCPHSMARPRVADGGTASRYGG